MATSVGEIGLDLVVNQNQFNKQMSGITGLAKKAGAALAAAFATKKIVDFGKQCLQLGSDLAEVQNVVDVTFPGMSAQVDKFAKSAAQSFGLSETMAKQYTGTFGSMAKAFGFTEKEAYDMGTTLTGLAGDVASFYNISQDEAYTKLKSVFTGETESLKDLGVVMTQSALDSYAMANGFGKTTQAMSEAEKVALRYAFVQDQLSAASGDFARTSGSWANQVRILKLQFDSLKATIGQGLINVFTPVIKVINTLMGKLVTLANHFKAFTELITGNKSSGSSSGGGALSDGSVSDLADQYDNTTASANDTAKANDKVAKSMKKAQKAAEGYLSPLDTIHKISSPDDTAGEEDAGNPGSAGSGTPANPGGSQGAAVDYGSMAKGETEFDKIGAKIDKLIQKAKSLAGLFKKGFFSGLGDDFGKRAEGIRKDLASIGKNVKDIFLSPEVMTAADQWASTVSYSLGQITGSVASVGLTIGQLLIGGVENYISENKDRIKEHLVNVFDISAEIMGRRGDFAEAFAYVFSALGSETGQQIMGDIIGVFAEIGMFITETAMKVTRDVEKMILQPFIDNKEKLKTAVDETLKAIEPFTDGILTAVQKVRDGFNEVYDNHLKPLFDSIERGLSEIFGKLLDGYNTYVAPVLQNLGEKFQELMEGPFGTMIDKIVIFLGKVIDTIKLLWESVLVPFFAWIAENIMPVLAPITETIGNTVLNLAKIIMDAIGNIMGILSGLIDFVVGVFTGDWDKAWNGIKEIAGSIWKLIGGIVSGGWKTIKDFVSGGLKSVKKLMQAGWDGIKSITESVWNGIKNVIKAPINAIIGFINGMVRGMASGVNAIANMLNNLRVDIPDWVPGFGGKSLGFNLPHWDPPQIPYLASGAVIPPNAPFMAMLGDQKNGNNIEAPESLLRKVVREESKGSNGGGNSTYVIPIYVSGRKLLEIIIEEAELKQARSGKNVFKLSTT